MNATACTLSLCLLAVTLGGCASSETAATRSREHVLRGDYYLAYQALRDELGSDAVATSDDPWVRTVYIAYLLQQGQNSVFNDQEFRAIEIFERVLEIEPGNHVASGWIEKAKEKLASAAVGRGDEYQSAGELREALMAYHEALQHVAGYEPALEGVEQVVRTVQKREARAEDQYIRGVGALGEQLYGITWYHMINAIELNPEHEQARGKRDLIGERLTRDRYERALALEESGHYGAALKEYLGIQQRAPDFAGLIPRIEHMRREVEAQRLIGDAEMAFFRGQFDRARELLETAFQSTSLQQPRVSELMVLIKEREFDARYDHARILELEHDLEEALAAYRGIDQSWQFEDGFKDVKARISGLEASIEAAATAYARGVAAEEKGELAVAIEAYEEALLNYPGYKNLGDKVIALRAKVGKPRGDG